MSASTEKKVRQAAREAGTDKKTLAMEKQAKEQQKSKRRWTLGTIAVAVVVALVLLLSSNLVYKTTAYTVGDKRFTAAEVNYRLANQYFNFANQYGQYASLFGLDTSGGVKGLSHQACPMRESGTWKDYFLDAARSEMLQTTVLCQYAAEQGITLDDEELAEIESAFEGLDTQARANGWKNGSSMLAANYGGGVNVDIVREAYRAGTLAQKALNSLSESFTYTPEQIEEKYQSFEGARDYFDYAYCYIAAETVETTGEDGQTSAAPTEETLAAAQAAAEKVMAAYEAAAGDLPAARLNNAAIAEGQSAVPQTHVQGSSLYIAAEWLKDAARQPGDVTTVADPNGNGWYVVVFGARNDNHYPTVNVRHILVRAAVSPDGTYSEEAKAEAKAKAEEILAEFESGDRTEESFAALAEQYSEDTGSNTKGGLYEGVAQGQMVQEFNDFCFGDRKSGDTAIVYGQSASYAGYHVMYYVGEGAIYSDTLAESALRNEDVSAWLEAAEAAVATADGFGMKFVG